MRFRALLSVMVAVAAVAGCGDDDGDAAGRPPAGAAVHAAVIRWFADAEPPLEGDQLREVYLDGLDDTTVAIDVQVDLVNALEDELKVRFIDAPEEAIDRDTEGEPVRNGGLLIHLGPLVERDGEVELDVARYDGAGESTRYRFVLVPRADEWRVSGEPERLPSADEPS